MNLAKKAEAELAPQRSEFLDGADEMVVDSHESYEVAATLFKAGRALEKKIKGWFAEPKKKAHDAWKSLVALEKDELAKVQPGIKTLSKKMETWEADQLRLRLEEEARLEREAQEKAEAEADERLKAAAILEEAGMNESADKLLDGAALEVDTVAPRGPVKPPKVKGMTVSRKWDFNVLDARQISPTYLVPDLVAIRRVVLAHGEGAVKIVGPGIEVYSKTIRGAR